MEAVSQQNDQHVEHVAYYNPNLVALEPKGEFFDNRRLVESHISEVVEKLAPISQEECYTIVSRAWGFSKKGNRIWNYLEICTKGLHQTKADDQVYLWNSPNQVEEVKELRFQQRVNSVIRQQ